MRIETGSIQFGDDWPGMFIRGDNAAYMSFVLKAVHQKCLNKEPLTAIELAQLKNICDRFTNCLMWHEGYMEPTKLKSAEEVLL